MRNIKWTLLGLWWRTRNTRPPVVCRVADMSPQAPRLSRARIYETEYPYRPGRVILARLHGSHGVQAGLLNPWASRDDRDIDNRLIEALKSAQGTPSWRDRAWKNQVAGNVLFKNVADEQERVMFSDMLGLDDERTRVAE